MTRVSRHFLDLGAAALALLLGGATACTGRGAASAVSHRDGGEGGVPSWLPAYSADQQLLLRPGTQPVAVPASRVYPNLERFGYANDRQLADPREAVHVTQMVAEVVEKSPRQYALLESKPEQANWVAQYGPPGDDEPDGWKIAAVDPQGEAHLLPSQVSSDAREKYDDALVKEKAGDTPSAIALLRKAIEESPDVPALRVALGKALEPMSPREAESAYHQAIGVDPTLSTPHEGLASLLFKRGDLTGARNELAQALAYHPKSRTGLALAATLAKDPGKQQGRVSPYAVFIEVDTMGAIHVAAPPTPAARMYGGCRAVFRYEPELRASLFEIPREEPYFLSATEEMLCFESAIGAFLVERAGAVEEKRRPLEDAQTAAILKIAHTDGLLGFVMFEVLGQRRPERARTAPQNVHQAAALYVEKHVLGYDPESDDGRFVASVSVPRR